MIGWIKRRIWWVAGAGVVVIAFVLIWFEPQALFINKQVDEALPGVSTVAQGGDSQSDDSMKDDESDDAMKKESAPTELAMGQFRGLAHSVSGTATILELDDGSRFLRLEDFEVENGPDLRVYLSAGDDYDADFVDLGDLKGNVGNQNYKLPGDVDLERYSNAVIWCRRFAVGFAVAPLG